MATSDERMFPIFRRGQVRDEVLLRAFRNHLRGLTDPDTGATFTEDKIRIITQRGSRFYLEADAIDLTGLALQNRDRWLANQVRPKWSNTEYLEQVHGPLWLPDGRLPATGGSGTATATAAAGSVFPGSTVIGDPAAAVAVGLDGLQYQVLTTETVPAGSTSVTLTLQCVDTGAHTNPTAGSTLTWDKNFPPSADLTFATAADFTGGYDAETDAEFADRVEQVIAFRPACGNGAHFVAWARECSTAIEAAFVYPCAWHAGSVLVCLTQKRGATLGPNARTDVAPGTLITARNYLVPPASPVVAEHAYVVVCAPNEQAANLALQVTLGYGSVGGWGDGDPWPTYSATYPQGAAVTTIVSPTIFRVQTDVRLPGLVSSLTGADAPQLMVWDEANSKFIILNVKTVTETVPMTTYTIELNAVPSGYTIEVDDILSPYTDRADILAAAITAYFDGLGPGEVVDLDVDPRGARAFRYPTPAQQYPSRAGDAIITRVLEALGGVAPDAALPYISRNSPDLPGDVIDGPNMVTLGEVGVYPL
jgi:uncharacterized phage protein gp47/JayE